MKINSIEFLIETNKDDIDAVSIYMEEHKIGKNLISRGFSIIDCDYDGDDGEDEFQFRVVFGKEK